MSLATCICTITIKCSKYLYYISEGKYPCITTMTNVGEMLLHVLYQRYQTQSYLYSFIKNLDKNSLVVQSLSQQEHIKHKQHNTKTNNTKTVMLRTSKTVMLCTSKTSRQCLKLINYVHDRYN